MAENQSRRPDLSGINRFLNLVAAGLELQRRGTFVNFSSRGPTPDQIEQHLEHHPDDLSDNTDNGDTVR